MTATGSAASRAAPAWATAMHRANRYLSEDFLGRSRVLRLSWVINAHKGMTFAVVLLLMARFDNYSVSAWIYLALHGSYGFFWLLKHAAFRDRRWESRVTFGGAALTFIFLATYWLAPYLLISAGPDSARSSPPAWLMAGCIALFALGLTMMSVSDCQKHFTLKVRPGLITDGMFRHVRHPNYLGEMMLYASFALLVRHWAPWLVLSLWWLGVFLPNMRMIEASLSRYPEWPAYLARTGMLLPWRLFTGPRRMGE